MILDNPLIQDESIKNKYLLKLQKKLIKPSKLKILPSKKEDVENATIAPLKPSVEIHRHEKLPYIGEEKPFEKIVHEEIDEDLFKDEDLYEIEKIEDDIPEFTEIKDETENIEDKMKEGHIKSEQKFETFDELPEWKTVDVKSSDSIIQKDKIEISNDIPEWEPIATEQFKSDDRM